MFEKKIFEKKIEKKNLKKKLKTKKLKKKRKKIEKNNSYKKNIFSNILCNSLSFRTPDRIVALNISKTNHIFICYTDLLNHYFNT